MGQHKAHQFAKPGGRTTVREPMAGLLSLAARRSDRRFRTTKDIREDRENPILVANLDSPVPLEVSEDYGKQKNFPFPQHLPESAFAKPRANLRHRTSRNRDGVLQNYV
jgi:hypothetical protein